MSLELNTNNNQAQYNAQQTNTSAANEVPKTYNNVQQNVQADNNVQAAQPDNGMQNIQTELVREPKQDVYQPQNVPSEPKPKNKLFLALAVIGAGAGVGLLIKKLKGKNPSSKGAKAVVDATRDALGSSASKAEEETGDKTKTSIFKRAKEKFDSLKDDMKKGYEEGVDAAKKEAKEEERIKRQNAPKPHRNKPKKPSEIMREKIAQTQNLLETGAPSIIKLSDSIRETVKLSCKTSDEAVNALNNKTEMDEWARKILADYSPASDPSIKRRRFSFKKKDIFNTDGVDRWSYNENCTQGNKRIKIKRRMEVDNNRIAITVDDVKNTKNGAESASEMLSYDRTTEEITQYLDYKSTPEVTSYKKGLTVAKDASGDPVYTYTKGYEDFNGTTKIAKQTKTYANNVCDYENLVYHSDGSEACSRITDYDKTTGEILHHSEGYVRNADGSCEFAREFDPLFGNYREGVKIFADGSEEALSKIELSPSNQVLAREHGCKITAAGDSSADIRIEYSATDGTAKTYYENYKKNAAGNISYTLKAILNPHGVWVRV